MNIFFLNSDPEQCAKEHCDKHVVKMILEHTQILSVAYRKIKGRVVDKKYILDDLEDVVYKASHINHPCTLWASQSLENNHYLRELTHFLNIEYQQRYGHSLHNHKSYEVMRQIPVLKASDYPIRGWTPPAVCVKSELIISDNPIINYRNYYLKDKARFATWKNQVPDWYEQQNPFLGY